MALDPDGDYAVTVAIHTGQPPSVDQTRALYAAIQHSLGLERDSEMFYVLHEVADTRQAEAASRGLAQAVTG